MTALLAELRGIIATEGPIPLSRYMALALSHPVHGYYTTRDPFGASGDFTTAPEISQMFGEMIGLWAGTVWVTMGRPARIALVELGPGRGTLMADALRAARVLPDFLAALTVHLVETSPTLRERQRAVLAGGAASISWHDTLDDVPPGPVIVIGNEFLDALPIDQWARHETGWHERLVGLGPDGSLAFGLAREPDPRLAAKPGSPGDVLEIGTAAGETARRLALRLSRDGGAALLIDYGALDPEPVATFQAVRDHRPVDPLDGPGEADLTAHVDFGAVARTAIQAGARVHGPVTQGDFLEALGIQARAARLNAGAGPPQTQAVESALARLTGRGDGEMGSLFKVIGMSSPDLAALPGLPAAVTGAIGRSGADLSGFPPHEVRMLIEAPELSSFANIRHAFFTRQGGSSGGVYASLNGGLGSSDQPGHVEQNRATMAEHLGVAPDRLVGLHQIHSAVAVRVDAPWPNGDRPRADAMATNVPGIALAIATADCGPVLFADHHAGVIGAAHAGWKGALGGVLDATVDLMEELGAIRTDIVAVLGPTIGRDAYEVGPEFLERFLAEDGLNATLFRPSTREGHALFDLPAYIGRRLEATGIGEYAISDLCTYSDEERFFSYRRATHLGEPDYGRLISAISLTH